MNVMKMIEYYLYVLKMELFDKELVPFLGKFYAFTYPKDVKLDAFDAILSTSKRLKVAFWCFGITIWIVYPNFITMIHKVVDSHFYYLF